MTWAEMSVAQGILVAIPVVAADGVGVGVGLGVSLGVDLGVLEALGVGRALWLGAGVGTQPASASAATAPRVITSVVVRSRALAIFFM
jgi:hypothetical protein